MFPFLLVTSLTSAGSGMIGQRKVAVVLTSLLVLLMSSPCLSAATQKQQQQSNILATLNVSNIVVFSGHDETAVQDRNLAVKANKASKATRTKAPTTAGSSTKAPVIITSSTGTTKTAKSATMSPSMSPSRMPSIAPSKSLVPTETPTSTPLKVVSHLTTPETCVPGFSPGAFGCYEGTIQFANCYSVSDFAVLLSPPFTIVALRTWFFNAHFHNVAIQVWMGSDVVAAGGPPNMNSVSHSEDITSFQPNGEQTFYFASPVTVSSNDFCIGVYSSYGGGGVYAEKQGDNNGSYSECNDNGSVFPGHEIASNYHYCMEALVL